MVVESLFLSKKYSWQSLFSATDEHITRYIDTIRAHISYVSSFGYTIEDVPGLVEEPLHSADCYRPQVKNIHQRIKRRASHTNGCATLSSTLDGYGQRGFEANDIGSVANGGTVEPDRIRPQVGRVPHSERPSYSYSGGMGDTVGRTFTQDETEVKSRLVLSVRAASTYPSIEQYSLYQSYLYLVSWRL